MKKILVIDDDDSIRHLVSEALQRAGYEVSCAENGKAGFKVFTQAGMAFDAVVTDLIMPEQEGIETIIALRKLRPGLKIIAMSGGGRKHPGDFLSIAKSLGASALLSKPFTLATLIETVGSLFSDSNTL